MYTKYTGILADAGKQTTLAGRKDYEAGFGSLGKVGREKKKTVRNCRQQLHCYWCGIVVVDMTGFGLPRSAGIYVFYCCNLPFLRKTNRLHQVLHFLGEAFDHFDHACTRSTRHGATRAHSHALQSEEVATTPRHTFRHNSSLRPYSILLPSTKQNKTMFCVQLYIHEMISRIIIRYPSITSHTPGESEQR